MPAIDKPGNNCDNPNRKAADGTPPADAGRLCTSPCTHAPCDKECTRGEGGHQGPHRCADGHTW